VEGIGEHIAPLTGAAQLPASDFIVVKPQAGLDTQSIFTAPNLTRDTKRAIIEDFAADHYGFGHNDLQPVAEALCPDVRKARQLLESLGLHATMTGSGSAVFAQTSKAIEMQDAPCGWQIKLCKNLEKHPLFHWIPE
jgi:4-diphosphocytidyl-2-C-methyl-D-erythritol kinase